MATKPTLVPRVWASAGIYTTGPFIGSASVSDPGAGIAAEGHRPGSSYPTAAEHENSQQNRISAFVAEWVALGASTGAADAHIVETNSTGRSVLRALTITNTVDETGLVMTSVNTVQPAVSFTCTTGATIVTAAMGNAAGVGFNANVGSGAGKGFDTTLTGSASGARGFVADLIGVAAGAVGVYVEADAATDADGISVLYAGTGTGLRVDSTTSTSAEAATFLGGSIACISATAISGGSGVSGTSGPAGGAGVFGAGGGANRPGVQGLGGSGGNGGTFTGLAAGNGVVGTGGNTAGTGVTGTGGTNGSGGVFTGNAGGFGVDVIGGGVSASATRSTASISGSHGVHGRTYTSASNATYGVLAEGRDNGVGLGATSVNSWAVVASAKISSPVVYSTMRMEPQDVYPSSINDGDFTYASSAAGVTGHLVHASAADAAVRGVHSSLGGYIGGTSQNNSASNSNDAVYTNLCTIVLAGGSVPKQGSRTALFSVKMRVRVSVSGTPGGIDVRIVDNTAVLTILELAGAGTLTTSGYRLAAGSTGWDANVSFDFAYTMPITSRSFTLAFKRQTGDTFTVTSQGGMTISGLY
jgi:hypothetical protein